MCGRVNARVPGAQRGEKELREREAAGRDLNTGCQSDRHPKNRGHSLSAGDRFFFPEENKVGVARAEI